MVDVTCFWANIYDKLNVICMILCCFDDGNLECGVDNPIDLDDLGVSSVADLGIKVLGPQVMSNFSIIRKLLMYSQYLLIMSLRLYSDWIQ